MPITLLNHTLINTDYSITNNNDDQIIHISTFDQKIKKLIQQQLSNQIESIRTHPIQPYNFDILIDDTQYNCYIKKVDYITDEHTVILLHVVV